MNNKTILAFVNISKSVNYHTNLEKHLQTVFTNFHDVFNWLYSEIIYTPNLNCVELKINALEIPTCLSIVINNQGVQTSIFYPDGYSAYIWIDILDDEHTQKVISLITDNLSKN